MMNTDGYHETRFHFDPRRATVWKTLIELVFCKFAPANSTVLELGAGFCEFINHFPASRKYAIDLWPDFGKHANPDVHTIVGSVTDLSAIPDAAVDMVFASNLFEHLSQEDFAACLREIKLKLSGNGVLTIMQPNYSYAYREYFDDYTHQVIWTHTSIVDFLLANGYDVKLVQPRFLPLSMKSRLPPWPILIKLYLMSPIKFMGKQMLVVATPRKSA